jgi:molecular chaperone GrpE
MAGDKKLARERDYYLSLAQKNQAELENLRKRQPKELALARQKAKAELARPMIQALDELLLAARHDSSQGLELIISNLEKSLSRAGLERFADVGDLFNPHCHEAVSVVSDPENPGHILEVLQLGWRLDGELLRAAKVVVSQG